MIAKADEKLKKYPIAGIVFALLTVILIIRGFYGFCQSDESFYVSTAGRFAAGDLIFVDEWHPTQLFSLITMPFYKLYTVLTGGTAGIILYFRVLFVLLTAFEAFVSYRIVSGRAGGIAAERGYADIPALALGLFLMLYCHLNMPTLSYYTLSYNFFIFAFILCYGGINRSGQGRGAYFTAGGAVFALSVLSLPSLAVAAVFLTAVLAVICLKVPAIRRPLFLFVIGILIPLALFIIYLYASGNSIAGLLANLPYIISDEEHDREFVESFKVFFRAISDVFGRIYYLSIVMVILAILSYVDLKLQRWIRPCILYTDLLLFIYFVVLASGHTGFINTAFALFVFPLFFLARRKDWYIFLALFMGGLVFSMTCTFSSYCDLYVLAVGHGIAAAGGLLLLWDMILELLEGRRLAAFALAMAAVSFIMVTAVLRFINVYRDDRISRLDTRITAGPAAGLYTSSEHKALYDSVLGSIMEYTDKCSENGVQGKNGGRVLFSKLLPWGYTAVNMRVAAPDTWRNTIASERLAEYYKSHEMPDIVFVLNTEVGAYESSGDVEADALVNLNEFSGDFADILRSEYNEYADNNCTVYIRKAD
ncbi:MAG: hypothetical protein IJT24_00530 [Lachnospiraceae bacterium]|nr:hypothetical protein [Lachnospiraceae bacterium]